MTTKSKLSLLFFIKRTKALKDGKVPIYVRITAGGSMTDVSIGESVDPAVWNQNSGYAEGKFKGARTLNDYIDSVKRGIHSNYLELIEKGRVITANSLKNAWKGIKDEEKTLIELFDDHNARAVALKGKEYSPGTVQKFEVSLRHIKDFMAKHLNIQNIALSKVNYDFITKFDFYLRSDRNCDQNTVVKYMKVLKKLMRIAIANGWIKQDPFMNYKLTVKKVDRGYLSDEELALLQGKEIKVERMAHVRDVFLFGCYTGLAYCDLKDLKPENISKGDDGNLWIRTNRNKTGMPCHVPLIPAAKVILDKYQNHPHCILNRVVLPVYSNQKQNAYLKEIADICGITKELTTHLARHTFATTITLNNDVPIESVSKMLGHSSIKMTQVYARLLDKKVSQDMSKLYDKY